MEPSRRRQMVEAIQSAFSAVWTMVQTLAAQLRAVLKTATDTATEIVRRAEAEATKLRDSLAKRERVLEGKEAQIRDDLAALDQGGAELARALLRVRGVEAQLSPVQAQTVRWTEELARVEMARIVPARARSQWAQDEAGAR